MSSATPHAAPSVWRTFLAYALPCAAILAIASWAAWQGQWERRLSDLRQAEEKRLALQAESIVRDFAAARTDLELLAEEAALRRALTTGASVDWAAAAAAFRVFSEKKQFYDQVRFLDPTGLEVLRINLVNGEAVVVPEADLQRKDDRYYVQAALALPRGKVFVSPFDLNVEDDQIEQPLKPTIRFAAGVFDADGSRRGIVVLNYLGREMLQRFVRFGAGGPGRSMLLNAEGFWLYAGDPAREWGFMYSDRQDVRFPVVYSTATELWQTEVGQQRTPQGLFTWETIHPLAEARTDAETAEGSDLQWKAVSILPEDQLAETAAAIRSAVLRIAASGGMVLAVVCWVVARNAVARRASEASLVASESRFRQMAAAIAEVFWLCNADRSRFLYVSPAFANIWGAPSAVDVIDVWRAAVHPDDRAAADAAFERRGEPAAFSAEYRIVRPDGETRWIWDHGFPVRDDAGVVRGYAGIAEDVTRLHAAQDRLMQSERLAAVGEAITGLAHESRNALQRSQSCLEMLAKRIADRPEALGLAARVQDALRELHRLYERVREYAAPTTVRRAPHDISDLLRKTCDQLADLIASRGAEIVVERPPDGNLVCEVDGLGMVQVLRNVLENALSEELDAAVERTQVRIRVAFSTCRLQGRDAVRTIIEDNGPGLSADAVRRAFEPFYTTKVRGTGLGLAIAQRIVAAHGGELEATSEPGKGLNVSIVLPRSAG